MEKRAILSVFDKSGLEIFGRGLSRSGWLLYASGGTARCLREATVPVTDIATLTGFPEMLGGRVKTLHPAVHAGILARDTAADRADMARVRLGLIDLVVCNLYPFVETMAQDGISQADVIEQIDIGGVALLRAAAKNFERVTVVVDPADYDTVLSDLIGPGISRLARQELAAKAFEHTQAYDKAIASFLRV